MNDTCEKANTYKYERLANMTIAERAGRLEQLILASRAMVAAGIRLRHPNCNDLEFKNRMAALLLGAEFTKKYYNWDPKLEGY